jgi:UDP-N-acetylglucosamine enolpyruvyl transferase
MVASLYLGEAILRLRQFAARVGGVARVQDILASLGNRRPMEAAHTLTLFDAEMAARDDPRPQVLRARAAILAMQEVLARHGSYFGAAGGGDAIL